ncbi:hypothetical protein GGI07_002487 [Coemansia sp. Benny D115]|nr:hypothetical protein GGI07_002487 [Coemansia sp. Benny D115]
MSEPAVFEICFPSHITRAPVCRPGQTVAGAVVLKLTSPLAASHLLLRFYGVERVRRTPVAVRTENSEKKQQQTTMSHQMVMDKEFFRRELVLWGERKVGSARVIPSDAVHRFHFSFTMPYVNMPTPRQTPDIEISYSLEATLVTEMFDQGRGEKVLRDAHKTGVKCFLFEPVIQQRISHGLAATAPLESIIELKDASFVGNSLNNISGASGSTAGDPRYSTSTPSILPFHSPLGKTHMSLHVFHPTPAYLPGETVELLVLAPANKKITSASFQIRENVRCRKSSAPIIDESDVPILWRYSVDIGPPQDITFTKLSKSNLTQDIGMLGRYLFTNHTSLPLGLQTDIAGSGKGIAHDHDHQQQHQGQIGLSHSHMGARSISDSSTMSTRTQSTKSSGIILKGDEGLAISNLAPTDTRQQQQQQQQAPQSRVGIPLSPLAESQEITVSSTSKSSNNSSSDTLNRPRSGKSSVGHIAQKSVSNSCSASSLVSTAPPILVRNRTGSLGGMHSQRLYPGASQYSPIAPAPMASSINSSSGSLHSLPKSIGDAEDSVSDRSSISDTLSIRYQPAKSSLSNFASLARTSSLAGGAAGNNAISKLNRLSVTPVPLGGLLAKGSYKFARISFTLPPISEMSPVSSVFLDYEYTVDMYLTIGGSFGTTRKTAGRLPLKIVTMRTAAKTSSEPSGAATISTATGGGGGGLHDPTVDDGRSLRDSLSVLNLSIAHPDDGHSGSPHPLHGGAHNGSPANTLTDFHFDNGAAAGGAASSLESDGGYPCLLSYLQNGEKIPIPELESINIGSNLM